MAFFKRLFPSWFKKKEKIESRVVQKINPQEDKPVMHISEAKFNKLFPSAKAGIYKAIKDNIENAGCKSKEQQAMFIAQCAVESGGFKTLEESLNYTPQGLLATFPSRINQVQAHMWGRQVKNGVVTKPADQEAIANHVYGSRMGNAAFRSGDGYRFRGRGIIQITGRDNYVQFNKWLNGKHDVLLNPDIISKDLNLAVMTAIWFWQYRGLAKYHGNVKEVTRLINGGHHGLDMRTKYYNQLMAN